MTPFKRPDSPYYQIQISPRGYPHEIRRSTGLTSKRKARAVESTLEDLAVQGHHEILDAVRDGDLHPTDVHGAYRAGRLDQLLRDEEDPPLEVVVKRFMDATYDDRLERGMRRLLRVAPEDARRSWLRDPSHIQEVANLYEREGLAAGTEHREMSGVSQLLRREFGDATRQEIWSAVTLRPKPRRRMRYLESDEIERAREVAGDWWTVFGLYLATGMRASELLDLKRRDVDLESGWIVVEAGKSAQSRREVPVGGEVLTALRGWVVSQNLASADPLFPRMHYDKVREAWVDIREAAGLDDEVTIHSLRHTYAVHMARAGMPLIELKRRLGHADISTTMRYAEYRPSERTRAYDRGLQKMGILGESPTIEPTRPDRDDEGDAQKARGQGGSQ